MWLLKSTLDGNVALLLNGSGAEKGSIFVVFLKNSSEEALNGSTSLNGSPPKGSITFRQITVSLNLNGQTFQIGLSKLSLTILDNNDL